MVETTHVVPEENLGKLENALIALARRAKRLGQEISWNIALHHHEEIKGRGFVAFYNVTLRGERPIINGWAFVATLQHDMGSTILRVVPGETVPTQYRNTGNVCEHCMANRERKDTFIVRHETNGYKQVGRTCLKDFMGHDDPHKVAGYAEAFADALDILEDAESYDPEAIGFGSRYSCLMTLLEVVAADVRMNGWVSRGAAREDVTGQKLATVDRASMIIGDKKTNEFVTEADRAMAQASIEWATALDEKPELSDYEHNIASIASARCYERRTMGLAGSIVAAYKRATETAKLAAESKHVGTIKKRETFTLTLRAFNVNEGYYGSTWFYRFVDADGNAVIWRSSKDAELIEGKTYAVTGSVKAHTEFRGVNQTELTRCKCVDLSPPPESAVMTAMVVA